MRALFTDKYDNTLYCATITAAYWVITEDFHPEYEEDSADCIPGELCIEDDNGNSWFCNDPKLQNGGYRAYLNRLLADSCVNMTSLKFERDNDNDEEYDD